MTGKDVVSIAALGALGYAAYKLFYNPAPGGTVDTVVNYFSEDPTTLFSSLSQLRCPQDEVFSRIQNRCIKVTVLDPRTNQPRDWQGTSGGNIITTAAAWWWNQARGLFS